MIANRALRRELEHAEVERAHLRMVAATWEKRALIVLRAHFGRNRDA